MLKRFMAAWGMSRSGFSPDITLEYTVFPPREPQRCAISFTAERYSFFEMEGCPATGGRAIAGSLPGWKTGIFEIEGILSKSQWGIRTRLQYGSSHFPISNHEPVSPSSIELRPEPAKKSALSSSGLMHTANGICRSRHSRTERNTSGLEDSGMMAIAG